MAEATVFHVTCSGYWRGRQGKEALEAYGFTFGPANQHGISAIIGPVTFTSDYGVEQYGVDVPVQTLAEMLALVRALRTVAIVMDGDTPYGDFAFLTYPAPSESAKEIP